ncbi:MAG: hypothetical protein HY518_04655 [Candidatus Aenigmarchaeota archaeon]|nr:hypothetical protein [Candidatus Aenigmarchaeota archaeon]
MNATQAFAIAALALVLAMSVGSVAAEIPTPGQQSTAPMCDGIMCTLEGGGTFMTSVDDEGNTDGVWLIINPN